MRLSKKIHRIATAINFNRGLLSVLLKATQQEKAVTFSYKSIVTNVIKTYTILPL
jgi:hypothetical protein